MERSCYLLLEQKEETNSVKEVIYLEAQDISEIKETRKAEEATRLINEGWTLDYREHGQGYSRYVLIKFK
ncbi:hypothetical protein NYE59_23335 [Paenibacillus sp. FSL L8-0323]|uniref:hypothetical protein n=1 Tax=Paenibacillus sp. FSL L8-0323 TaxID=2975330 RepID=UPI0030FB736D